MMLCSWMNEWTAITGGRQKESTGLGYEIGMLQAITLASHDTSRQPTNRPTDPTLF